MHMDLSVDQHHTLPTNKVQQVGASSTVDIASNAAVPAQQTPLEALDTVPLCRCSAHFSQTLRCILSDPLLSLLAFIRHRVAVTLSAVCLVH